MVIAYCLSKFKPFRSREEAPCSPVRVLGTVEDQRPVARTRCGKHAPEKKQLTIPALPCYIWGCSLWSGTIKRRYSPPF